MDVVQVEVVLGRRNDTHADPFIDSRRMNSVVVGEGLVLIYQDRNVRIVQQQFTRGLRLESDSIPGYRLLGNEHTMTCATCSICGLNSISGCEAGFNS